MRHVWAMLLVSVILIFAYSETVCLSQTVSSDRTPLRISIHIAGGSYVLGVEGIDRPVLRSFYAVKINNHWLRSNDCLQHQIQQSLVTGELGAARQWTVTCFGQRKIPVMTLVLRAYITLPFGDIQVIVSNKTANTLTVQDLRPVLADGDNGLYLGDDGRMERVLSDSLSADRPEMRVLDLQDAPNGEHLAVGSQLIYDRQSHIGLFFGALTSDKFLTILQAHVTKTGSGPKIDSYLVDSTGTTGVLLDNSLHDSPAEDKVELSVPLLPGESLASERLLFSISNDYHNQLETYGKVVRKLHGPRTAFAVPTPMGWWSWTAYYFNLNQGEALTNATWLSQHLRPLGYKYFLVDEGYQYARGEYLHANADLFPDGMRSFFGKVREMGLVPAIWVAPFEVSGRSWIYIHHKDWLVHNLQGKPIHCGWLDAAHTEPLFALDPTNPGAQELLRKTYTTMVQQWGIRYIKLDFMVDTSVEGRYYRPGTTALEAQRIGLSVIRKAVGDNIMLERGGGEILNSVGSVDIGRISNDTGHTFYASKVAAPGIAARYYMDHNFFLSDPDAFTVSNQLVHDPDPDPGSEDGVRPLTLNEAEVSIALATIAGGTFEIGDDLPCLGADQERLALVTNKDLLRMVRLQRASVPLDLMSYSEEDKQPSIFLLHEDQRTSILTVFNWTEGERVHAFPLKELGLTSTHSYQVADVFHRSDVRILTSGPLRVFLPARSVRMMKITDMSVPPVPIQLDTHYPMRGKIGASLAFSVHGKDNSQPIVQQLWDFGDGTASSGPAVTHTYTRTGMFHVALQTEGVEGTKTVIEFPLTIYGTQKTKFIPASRRGP